MCISNRVFAISAALVLWSAGSAAAQTLAAHAPAPAASIPSSAGAVVPPPDYTIGPDDVLTVMFWRDKELSTEVVVRPDGKISLPLLNDVTAGGLTPEQLRDRILEGARQFVQDPNASVVVKQVNSRKVFITGEVAKPGTYPLTHSTTVLQLIATAGGLKEFVDGNGIVVMRTEAGKQVRYPFNYKNVVNGKTLAQNIELKPGDTVVVP
jgi:polysaccharide biosynthesis/export protein